MSPRVLVTGFGPFPGAPENPSQRMIEGLREHSADARDYELHTAVLPTRYHAAREMALRLHRRLRPDIAVHFGFSLRAKGFTLERTAENRIAPGRLDAAGARPARAAIRQSGPLACPSTLPLAAMQAALREAGLPAALSDDAGAYVCNLVFYAAAARRRAAMAGFVHIPLAAEMKPQPIQRAREQELFSLRRAELLDGTRLIVEACVAEWRRRGGAGRKKCRPQIAGGSRI